MVKIGWYDARYASQEETDAYNAQPHVNAYNAHLARLAARDRAFWAAWHAERRAAAQAQATADKRKAKK